MSKRIISFFCLFLVFICGVLAEPVVYTSQSCQLPKQKYVQIDAPVISPDSIVNLKYDIVIEGKPGKEDKHAVIDCIVKCPNNIPFDFLTASGIQAVSVDGEEKSAITEYAEGDYHYYEFLLPQKDGFKAHVQFQTYLDDSMRGQIIPIDISYTLYRKPFWKRWGSYISLGTGAVVGTVVGVLAKNTAAGIATGAAVTAAIGGTGGAFDKSLDFVTTVITRESLHEIKSYMNKTELNSSSARYVIQVQ